MNNKENISQAWKIGISGLAIILIAMMQGCGSGVDGGGNGPNGPIPGPGPQADESVVRGVAVYVVNSDQRWAGIKLFDNFMMPTAYAATGATNVTYNNAAAVSFTINVSAFGGVGATFTGDTLNLGSVALSGLDDNSLKVCGVGGNQKCTKGIIRVYTTGSIAGFVNTADGYGVPVYTGTLNPSTALGLNSAGAVAVQEVTIAANKNRLRLSDFPSPSYAVTSDFSNAGSGSYSMTYVVEYALSL